MIKYAVHILFACALAYFGLLAFVIEKDPMLNKMIMIMIVGFWLLWIFAKSVIKIMLAIVLLGAMLFAGYYVLHYQELECKNAGRHWNKELKVCEDKKTMTQRLKDAAGNLFKTTFKKWTSDNIKVEKTDEAEPAGAQDNETK